MLIVFWRIRSLWTYWRKAVSRHGVHSPFVFEFIHYVMAPMHFYAFDELEELRRKMLQDERLIEVNDLGAGSKKGAKQMRKVSEIANVSLSPKISCQVLFRLINHYELRNQIELGTSLGLSSLYLAASSSKNNLTTFEGSPEIADVALENFGRSSVQNIELIKGNFDSKLSEHLENKSNSIDFAFVDGNHRKDATLRYYEQLLAKTHEGSVLVFDDIHWSPPMEEAWAEIVADSRNSITIDWYRLGFVFFRKGIEKQHFVLKQRP
ncbi:O-methyltransferase [Halocola ammonii]